MLRLLMDENIDPRIVRGLLTREPTLDVVRVQDVGLRTADDPDILAWAADAGRVLVTKDRATMSDYAYARVQNGEPMPGVLLLSRNLSIGDAIEEVLLAAECMKDEEICDLVQFLPL